VHKGTNKREQYKTKTRFCFYCRAKVSSSEAQGTKKNAKSKRKTTFLLLFRTRDSNATLFEKILVMRKSKYIGAF